jgi:hypothetical protein
MVSVTGTGAIAIPVPQSSAMAHATQVIADLILPIPDAPKTTRPAPPAGPVTGQPVMEQPVNGSLATRQHGTAGEVEDAFARQTATGRCVVTEVPAGSASVRLSAGQLGELTARERVDPAFAARIGERRQMLCGEASKGSRPESAVRVG